jgi:hypothetical protein
MTVATFKRAINDADGPNRRFLNVRRSAANGGICTGLVRRCATAPAAFFPQLWPRPFELSGGESSSDGHPVQSISADRSGDAELGWLLRRHCSRPAQLLLRDGCSKTVGLMQTRQSKCVGFGHASKGGQRGIIPAV